MARLIYAFEVLQQLTPAETVQDVPTLTWQPFDQESDALVAMFRVVAGTEEELEEPKRKKRKTPNV
jgi:hypothetical protein